MAEAFGIGDIVKLKSGSCDMVVEGFEVAPIVHPHTADRLIRCVWMAADIVQSHVFATHLLIGVKEDKDTVTAREAKDKAAREQTERDRKAAIKADQPPPAPFAPSYPPNANAPDNRVPA